MQDNSYKQKLKKQIGLGEAFEQALARLGPEFSPTILSSFGPGASTQNTSNQNQPMTGPLRYQHPLLQTEPQSPFANHPQQTQTPQQTVGGTMGPFTSTDLLIFNDLGTIDSNSGLLMPDSAGTGGKIAGSGALGRQQNEVAYPGEQTTQEEQIGVTASFRDLADG
ncbi:hypothetical protein AC579_1468 [Pseudocercospora musae]|uniref:Uncharacterized protein n=1 Tax=Pseudocercospora musae TaxID=113226 RepID=A0A139I018_9PEZI|nr:hypothetical protein AC579_1468 [Pseudocercospora musae]